MISLWEKQSFLSSDIIIIGAGITGLSAAASLKEKDPSLSVTLLERGILPTGASTKNAGFACFGSVSELLNDIQTLGADGMVSLVEKRWNGLQKTTKRLGAKAIDLQINGGYELLFKSQSETINQVDKVNDLLKPLFNQKVYRNSDEKISSFGLWGTSHLIENQLEGQLDTGKLISSLWHYCAKLGVKVHTGCEVLSIEEDQNDVRIHLDKFSFLTKKVGICTNAFTQKFIKDPIDISPGRGVVLSIKTHNPLKLKGTYHYDEGYFYFRDYYGKLIFGGGRNLDIKTEATTEFGINSVIKEKLLEDLKNIVLPNQRFDVEMEWAGIMAFGKTKEPIIKRVTDKVVLGVRLGGMGVAIGSLVGEEVAELLLD